MLPDPDSLFRMYQIPKIHLHFSGSCLLLHLQVIPADCHTYQAYNLLRSISAGLNIQASVLQSYH